MRFENLFDTDDEAAFLYRWFLKKRDDILTDNLVFFLHYHVTSAIFMLACLVVTVGMFIMDPIDCITDQAVDDVIDNYCLYHSTYTISVGSEITAKQDLQIHPGIPVSTKQSSRDMKYHHYYLWVAMMLIIQGVSFYIPRGLWKYLEGSRVRMILIVKNKVFTEESVDTENNPKLKINTSTKNDDQIYENSSSLLLEKEDPSKVSKDIQEEKQQIRQQEQQQCLMNYILSSSHNTYYWKLLTCELLNLGNAIAQLLIIDMFVGLGLSRADLDIFQLIRDGRPFHRIEAVEQMFPKITACTFYSYGPSGSIVNYQAICVLPINAINEKIFGLLFLWMLMLIAISALAVLYRLMFLLPVIRNTRLKLYTISEEVAQFRLSTLKKRLKIGNWQLLLQLTGNNQIDSWEMTKIVEYLCEHLVGKYNKRM